MRNLYAGRDNVDDPQDTQFDRPFVLSSLVPFFSALGPDKHLKKCRLASLPHSAALAPILKQTCCSFPDWSFRVGETDPLLPVCIVGHVFVEFLRAS